jgi:hypothetical protein
VALGDQSESPALLTGIALGSTELGAVCCSVVAEIVAVLHLTEVRRGTPDLYAFSPIPNEDIWRVGSTLSCLIVVRNLEGLLFVKLHIGITKSKSRRKSRSRVDSNAVMAYVRELGTRPVRLR